MGHHRSRMPDKWSGDHPCPLLFQRATESLGTIISLCGCTNRWRNPGGLAGTRFCTRETANPCSRGPRDSAGRNGKDNVYLRYNRRAKRCLSESGWYGMDGSNVSGRIAPPETGKTPGDTAPQYSAGKSVRRLHPSATWR